MALNIELLYRVADAIQAGCMLMGSKWGNAESENIACSVIRASRNNHRNHGEAFSWAGPGLTINSPSHGVNNAGGLDTLVCDGMVIVEPYAGDLHQPNVVGENRPVLRPTNKLLEYAATLCGLQIVVTE